MSGALLIDQWPPALERDSGSTRTWRIAELLLEHFQRVVMAADGPGPMAVRGAGPAGVEVLAATGPAAVRRFLATEGAPFSLVILTRAMVARRYLDDVRRCMPGATVWFDTVDLHHVREYRGARVGGSRRRLEAALRMQSVEMDLVARTDLALVVSDAEAEVVRARLPEFSERVRVLSNIEPAATPGLPFAERHDVVFAGNFAHEPNVDGALWMAGEVMPRLRTLVPGVRLRVIGRNPPPGVLSLAADDIWVGEVDAMGRALAAARVGIAPLRYGAGVKGKVTLAMAMGLPVVATPIGVEGTGARHNHEVLVATTAAGLADEVARLYGDESLWSRLAAAGRELADRRFGVEAARQALADCLRARQ